MNFDTRITNAKEAAMMAALLRVWPTPFISAQPSYSTGLRFPLWSWAFLQARGPLCFGRRFSPGHFSSCNSGDAGTSASEMILSNVQCQRRFNVRSSKRASPCRDRFDRVGNRRVGHLHQARSTHHTRRSDIIVVV